MSRLHDLIDDLFAGSADYAPDYITSTGLVTLSSLNVDETDFTVGRIHTKTCNGSQRIKFSNGTVLTDVVLVTNCKIVFSQGMILENVIIATEYSGTKSMSSPSSLQIGRYDSCATDGGTQLLSMGDMDFAAGLEVYGSQLIAMGDIEFSANADGIEGASFIAGGLISGTSNMVMGFCGNGMERNFEADYFRLAS